MKIDKRTLERILQMEDAQLETLIRQIAQETGLDPKAVGIGAGDVQSIRQALQSATPSDIDNLNRMWEAYRNQRKRE